MITFVDFKFFFKECKYRINSRFRLSSVRKKFLLSTFYKDRLCQINKDCGALYEDLLKAGYENLMEITYPELSFKEGYVKNFIETSHFKQFRAWKQTSSRGALTQKKLQVYYNQFKGMPYCGFQKLHNLRWIRSRMSQFRYLEDSGFIPNNMSYLEFGGATGLLALVASRMGFKNVTNLEINSSASKIGTLVAQKLSLDLMTVDSPPEKETFDVISCHQVIEHYLDPLALLTTLKKLLSKDGVLFISHGYNLPEHPGHIPLIAPSEFENFLLKSGYYVIDNLPSGTFVLRAKS